MGSLQLNECSIPRGYLVPYADLSESNSRTSLEPCNLGSLGCVKDATRHQCTSGNDLLQPLVAAVGLCQNQLARINAAPATVAATRPRKVVAIKAAAPTGVCWWHMTCRGRVEYKP